MSNRFVAKKGLKQGDPPSKFWTNIVLDLAV